MIRLKNVQKYDYNNQNYLKILLRVNQFVSL